MTQNQLNQLKKTYTKRQLWSMYSSQVIREVCWLLDIELFDKQKVLIHDPQKVKVLRSARRTGKSFTASIFAYSLLYFGFLFDYDMRLVGCGPRTYDVRHLWRYLNAFWQKAPLSQVFANCHITYSNSKSETDHDKKWSFSNGTQVVSASGNEIQMNDIRGDANDWVFVDEFGQMRYKEQLLSALMYTLKDKQPLGLAWLVGTHDVVGNGIEFDELYKKGQAGHKNIISYSLKGSENPHTDQDSADVAKDVVSTESWLREEQGESVPMYGRMFGDYFDPRKQIIPLEYQKNEKYVRGLDFGMRKPYWNDWQWRIINGQWSVCVFHEYQGKDIRIKPLMKEMEIREDALMFGCKPDIFGVDPAGNAVNDVIDYTAYQKIKEVYDNAGYTRRPHLVSKANQVSLLKTLFLSRRFYVDPSCEMLIRSIVMATPDMNRQGAVLSAGWKKEKGIDDPLDATCMGLIRFAPTSSMIKAPKEKDPLTPSKADELVQRLGALQL